MPEAALMGSRSEARPRVAAARDNRVREEDWRRLGESVELVELGEALQSEEALVQALRGCQGFLRLGHRSPRLTRQVLAALPALKIVGLGGDRLGHGIDLEAAEEQGVAVVDADNISSAQPVAEWDLAMILLCLRNAGAVFRQMMAATSTGRPRATRRSSPES